MSRTWFPGQEKSRGKKAEKKWNAFDTHTQKKSVKMNASAVWRLCQKVCLTEVARYACRLQRAAEETNRLKLKKKKELRFLNLRKATSQVSYCYKYWKSEVHKWCYVFIYLFLKLKQASNKRIPLPPRLLEHEAFIKFSFWFIASRCRSNIFFVCFCQCTGASLMWTYCT